MITGTTDRGPEPAAPTPPLARSHAAPIRAPLAEERFPLERTDLRIVGTLVVLLVVTQRIGVPVGDTTVGVALPIAYALLGVLLARRRLTVSRLRAELYVLAIPACLAVSAVVDMRGGSLSTSSLLLLVVVYLPWMLRFRGDGGAVAVEHAGRVFVRVMLVLSTLGVLQLVTQLAGWWRYQDFLAQFVPSNLLIYGYHTANPLGYGSPVIKANGFALLEPSALSQFCALAVVVAVTLRMRAWIVLVLAAGLGSAVSGTGIILLAASSALMLVVAPRGVRPSYFVVLAAAITAVLLSPVAPYLLDRTNELSDPASSGYARFVAPYSWVLHALQEHPSRYLTGAGAGNSQRLLSTGVDATLFSTVPKLAFEYGLIAGGLVALLVVVGTLYRAPWRVVPTALVLMTVLLQGGLLQPQTAFLAWALSAAGSRDDSDSASPRDAWWRSWAAGRSGGVFSGWRGG